MGRVDELLHDLPFEARQELARHHFDPEWFQGLAGRLRRDERIDNRVRGTVTAPAPEDLLELPVEGSAEYARLAALGEEALRDGACALVVLAGGMATRMGGVVKALVEASDGHSFLQLRLREVRAMAERYGKAPPLFLMTSNATDAPLKAALAAENLGDLPVATFTQHLSLRLTPNGEVFYDQARQPSLHAPGHGDLPDALKASGLLAPFVEGGGRVVMVANIDNLGAALTPVVIGAHLSHGKPLSCEVVNKVGSDRGGIPVRWNDRPVILEEFRLPEGFDGNVVRVFNTNTFLIDARQLLDLDLPWTYFFVNKQVDGAPVVQFERLLGEATSHLDTQFLLVPRDGHESRFLPVKDTDELEARRSEIAAVCRSRGILP